MERLSRHEAAEYLRVSPRTLDAWRLKDEGPRCFKVAGRVWYLRLDIDAWIQNELVTSARGGVR